MRSRTLLTCAVLALAAASHAVAKPNILLILADDLGYSDLGCYGGEIATPNLDRLAAKGLRFARFFNAAKCEPTRASLMSGQFWNDCGLGLKDGITMGQALRPAGYATFAVGKWHLDGNPVERGFDRYFGHLNGGTDYFKGDDSYRLDGQPFTPPAAGFYATDANADYAVRFIEEAHQKQPDQPFFMYLAFNAPHSPLQALPEDIAKYRGKYRAGWDELRAARYRKLVESGIIRKEWPLPPRPGTVPAWDSLSPAEQDFEDHRMAIFAAMVDRMDQAIGRVLASIKALGKEDNTLVVFLSDNGAAPFDRARKGRMGAPRSHWQIGTAWANASATPFRHYKRNMGNGGSCTPCIVSWPGRISKPGSIRDDTAHIIDLMATFVDVGGASWPQTFDGRPLRPPRGESLRPVFAGETLARREPLFFQLFGNIAVIEGDLKLVSDWGRPFQLFNLATDRTELRDLASEQAAEVVRLKQLWQDWAANTTTRVRDGGGEPIHRASGDPAQRFIPEPQESARPIPTMRASRAAKPEN